MSNRQRVMWYGALLTIGGILLLLGVLGRIDTYWSSLGSVLAVMATFRLVQAARYARDPAHAQRVEVGYADERNAYVAGKSAATTFRVGAPVLAALSIVLRPFGFSQVADMLGLVMCGELMLYWASYLFFSRKY